MRPCLINTKHIMKKLFYVLTGLCLLAGVFIGCEKESEKAKSTIKGVVTDKETGEPLSGVIINLQPGNKQVQTAEDGAYILERLKAGVYTLQAQKDGYNDYENEEIRLGVEQTFTLDIEMTEATPCTLEGKVTDKKTGSPLSDVTITLQPGNKQVKTEEDGTYRFDSLKVRKYTLKAQKDGYVECKKEEIQLVVDQNTTLDVEMEEPFVEFQITDERGNIIEEMGCGIESSFKLKNIGNIAGEWRMEWDADWITEISPTSGTLAAGATETITMKKKLEERDKEMVLTVKTDQEDLHLKIVSKGFAGIELVFVEGGTFEMGATAEQGEDVEDDEKPVRTIRLDSYHIGKYQVTQAQWKAVMGTDPSYFKGDNLPVETVSWNDAQEFCKKLSEQTGKKYVLPTEAQWEYAARGGNKSQHYKYAGSNDIDEVAWYWGNSGLTLDENHPDYGSHPVGTKKANELGIYDMSGNVWEWCLDWYGKYDENDTENPQGPQYPANANEPFRVCRGGSWNISGILHSPEWRVSTRGYDIPNAFGRMGGFRVAVLP